MADRNHLDNNTNFITKNNVIRLLDMINLN